MPDPGFCGKGAFSLLKAFWENLGKMQRFSCEDCRKMQEEGSESQGRKKALFEKEVDVPSKNT